MKKRLLLIVILIFSILVTINTIVYADTSYIDEYVVNTEYTNSSSVPKEIYYNKNGLKGTLKLKEVRVSSGQAPRVITYKEDVSYRLLDYCVWYPPYMNFVSQTGAIPWSKVVSKEGYSFTVNLSATEYHQVITSYAAPNYEVRGHTQYTDEYGQTFTVSEDAWVGNSGVKYGDTYHTAKHYMRGSYTGSTTTNDTRKYVGVYSGNLSKVTPIEPKISIKNYKYAEPNTKNKWINTREQFIINTSIKSESPLIEYPTSTSLFIGGTGLNPNSYQRSKFEATKTGVTANGVEGINRFKPQGYTAIQTSNYTLSSDHKLIAGSNNHALRFPIYTQGMTKSDKNYYSNVVKGSETLCVDGVAPVLNSTFPESNWNKEDVTFSLSFKDLDSGLSATCC